METQQYDLVSPEHRAWRGLNGCFGASKNNAVLSATIEVVSLGPLVRWSNENVRVQPADAVAMADLSGQVEVDQEAQDRATRKNMNTLAWLALPFMWEQVMDSPEWVVPEGEREAFIKPYYTMMEDQDIANLALYLIRVYGIVEFSQAMLEGRRLFSWARVTSDAGRRLPRFMEIKHKMDGYAYSFGVGVRLSGKVKVDHLRLNTRQLSYEEFRAFSEFVWEGEGRMFWPARKIREEFRAWWAIYLAEKVLREQEKMDSQMSLALLVSRSSHDRLPA